MLHTDVPLPLKRTADYANPPDVSAEQRASNELIQLIRKLRWMGMEDEVEELQRTLAHCLASPAYGVIGGSIVTD
jgi:hypothetical protein